MVIHKAFIYLLLAILCVFQAGCSSPSKKLTSTNYTQGAYVKQETQDKALSKKEILLSIDTNSVSVKQKNYYTQRATDYYQKVHNKRYEVTEGADAGDVVSAFLMTPIALVGDAFLALGILVGEFMPFTVMTWEDVADTRTRYTSERDVVPNEYITKSSTNSSSKTMALKRAEVDLYLNNQFQGSKLTNDDGYLYFDSAEMLMKSNIHPKNLIHNQGLKVSASYYGVSESVQISNSQISESYFEAKYQELKPEMMGRAAKLGNCESIASSYREIFECFYQSIY